MDPVTDDGYDAEDTDDEAFGAVVERFRRHEAVVDEHSHGEWPVRYDGSIYWAGLGYGGVAEA